MTTLARRLRLRLQRLLRASGEAVGSWADALDPPPDPLVDAIDSIEAPGDERPAHLADAPEHWYRLVAEHAPGLLSRQRRETDVPWPARVPLATPRPDDVARTDGADADRLDAEDGSWPHDAVRAPASGPARDERETPEGPATPRPAPVDATTPAGERDVDVRRPVDELATPPVPVLPTTTRSPRLVPIRSRDETAPTRSAPSPGDPAREAVRAVATLAQPDQNDVSAPAAPSRRGESPVQRVDIRQVFRPAPSAASGTHAQAPPVQGGARVDAVDIGATRVTEAGLPTPTPSIRGGWPGVPEADAEPSTGRGPAPAQERARELFGEWRAELDEAQEEVGWTASSSS